MADERLHADKQPHAPAGAPLLDAAYGHDPVGLVMNIQSYSTKDGPGIRSTVFMVGCNLRCLWCSNPESMYPGKKVMYHANLCHRCGACAQHARPAGSITVAEDGCTIDRGNIENLFEIPDVCNFDAYELKGREMRASEVASKLLRDKAFYETSGGGVTFSGGECLMQADFVRAVAERLHAEGIKIALDTAGLWDYDRMRPVLDLADLVLYDIKAWDPEIHRRCTGQGNARILENARRLAVDGHELIVRLVVVPGYNDERGDVERRLDFISSLGGAVRQVDVLKYHKLGLGKYRDLGLEYPIPDVPEPTDQDVQWILDYGRELGLTMTVSG